MIKLTDNLWIGDSTDECYADLDSQGINAILNVAHDLQGSRGWLHGIEYAQVGLVDGPGNTLVAYHAAVLVLAKLVRDGKRVLVCCHAGGRSMAVVMMFLRHVGGRSWDEWFEILSERIEQVLPTPHDAHRAAYNRMNWNLLMKLGE